VKEATANGDPVKPILDNPLNYFERKFSEIKDVI
jgi:hypothetical protein